MGFRLTMFQTHRYGIAMIKPIAVTRWHIKPTLIIITHSDFSPEN